MSELSNRSYRLVTVTALLILITAVMSVAQSGSRNDQVPASPTTEVTPFSLEPILELDRDPATPEEQRMQAIAYSYAVGYHGLDPELFPLSDEVVPMHEGVVTTDFGLDAWLGGSSPLRTGRRVLVQPVYGHFDASKFAFGGWAFEEGQLTTDKYMIFIYLDTLEVMGGSGAPSHADGRADLSGLERVQP